MNTIIVLTGQQVQPENVIKLSKQISREINLGIKRGEPLIKKAPKYVQELLEKNLAVVLFINQKFAGFMCLSYLVENQAYEPGGLIIKPKHRNKGYAKLLLQKLIEITPKGCALYATVKQDKTAHVFEVAGFTIGSFASLNLTVLQPLCIEAPCYKPLSEGRCASDIDQGLRGTCRVMCLNKYN